MVLSHALCKRDHPQQVGRVSFVKSFKGVKSQVVKHLGGGAWEILRGGIAY